MGKQITIEQDFFVGNDYWQFKANVYIRFGEVWDINIVWAKGAGPDDESLEITESIEDMIKEKAEDLAEEMLKDHFSVVNQAS